LVFSLGALTKMSFLYFVIIIGPVLLFIRVRDSGLRTAFVWLLAFVAAAGPTTFFFLHYGRASLANAKASSFGGLAALYQVAPWQFLRVAFQASPGLALWLTLIGLAAIYLAAKNRPHPTEASFLALLLTLGFLAIVLASPNKQVRYMFPVIVAVPFLFSVVISTKKDSVSTRSAVLAACIVLPCLLGASVLTRYRTSRYSFNKAEAVLAEAGRLHASSLILATDSQTLNVYLLNVASEFSAAHPFIGTLAYNPVMGVPIQDDFRIIGNSDLVVFQDGGHISPRFTNQRVSEYQNYIRQLNLLPIRVGDDMTVFPAHFSPMSRR